MSSLAASSPWVALGGLGISFTVCDNSSDKKQKAQAGSASAGPGEAEPIPDLTQDELRALQNDVEKELESADCLQSVPRNAMESLSEYVVCMVSEKKTPPEIKEKLEAFLGNHTLAQFNFFCSESLTDWLWEHLATIMKAKKVKWFLLRPDKPLVIGRSVSVLGGGDFQIDHRGISKQHAEIALISSEGIMRPMIRNLGRNCTGIRMPSDPAKWTRLNTSEVQWLWDGAEIVLPYFYKHQSDRLVYKIEFTLPLRDEHGNPIPMKDFKLSVDNLLVDGLATSNSSSQPSSSSSRLSLTHAGDRTQVHDVRWEYNRHGQWEQFLPENIVHIETFWVLWQFSSNPQDGGSRLMISVGAELHEINFDTMQETLLETGISWSVRRRMESISIADDSKPFKRRRLEPQLSHDIVTNEQKVRLLETQLAMWQNRAQTAEADRAAADLQVVALRASETDARECLQATGRCFQAELEAWRHQFPNPAETHMRPHLVPMAQEILRTLVPRGHHSECARMRNAVVSKVSCVTSMQLWKQYNFTRQQFADALRQRRNCPWASTVAPPVQQMENLVEYAKLDRSANEVLLLHGTTKENIAHILRQGFDERLSQRKLFGPGIYFTTDTCKAAQYCGHGETGCIIVSRVLLGHPFLAEGPMPTHERPPEVEGYGVPHNSIIARPGIPNGKGKGKGKAKGNKSACQVHWEFVVPRGDLQIYPELIIEFTS